ncbi:MAG: hypothetical protein VKL41_02275 [Snowella sp.]|nr:hypothetical protein [Snowella sp.]
MLRSHGLPITHTLVMDVVEEKVQLLYELARKQPDDEYLQTAVEAVKSLRRSRGQLQRGNDNYREEIKRLKTQLKNQGKQEPVQKITSYEEFKEVVLEAYKRLNYEYNYNSFVPIYVIRRDIGDQVTRSQFKEWMLKIRVERIFSLYICDDRTLTQEEIQDSIYDDNLGTRYFFAQKN